MSIRELSLRELRALAQQRLGNRAAELKTRQELVEALEATERKKAPRSMVPLAAPLPVPVPVVVAAPVPLKELPPDLVIWTGEAPLPQITPRPLLEEFPAVVGGPAATAARKPAPIAAAATTTAPAVIFAFPRGGAASAATASAASVTAPGAASAIAAASTSAVARGSAAPAAGASATAESAASVSADAVPSPTSRSEIAAPRFARSAFAPPGIAPPALAAGPLPPGSTVTRRFFLPPEPSPPPARATEEDDEFASIGSTITQHFFLSPEAPRLPLTYEDNRVLTFARDPKTIYAAWDFSAAQFEHGPARGEVVNEAGVTVQWFAVAGPAGGQFLEELPPGARLKVEVHGEAGLIGESRWVQLPPSSRPIAPQPSGDRPASGEADVDRPNAPSSAV